MKPVLSQVLFKPFPSPEQTESGIFVPENARPISNKGTIVAVGNGTKEYPMRLKVGDVAYRTKLWGTEVVEKGAIYFIMTEDSFLAVD